MEIKIEGTVTINTEAADAIQLISNEATFNELMHILITRPEVLTAAANEADDRADAVKEAKLRKSYGDDYELIVGHPHMEKAKRRPGAIQLRENFPCIARTEIGRGGACEVYSNGYAIYDNGDRRTVLWVPDCSTTTYYFGKLRLRLTILSDVV